MDYFKKQSWKLIAQSDLPFLPTPIEVIQEIFLILEKHSLLTPNQKLVDLGAGDGRILFHACEKYHLDATGLEINNSFIDCIQAEILRKKIQNQCRIYEADFYNYNLKNFDLIFSFLLPSSHTHFKHVIESIKTGGIMISIRWNMDYFKEYWSKEITLNTNEHYPVYIYIKK